MTSYDEKVAAGARLKRVRLAAGYATQRDFAEALDVGLTTYSKWELGQRRPPNHILAKISNLTGATTDYLFLGKVDGLPVHLYRKVVGNGERDNPHPSIA